MTNVYEIRTGEPIIVKKARPNKRVIAIIESLYQRRHQIEELIYMGTEKTTRTPFIASVTDNDYSARAMVTYLDDFVRGFSDED